MNDPEQTKMRPFTIPLRRDGTTAVLNAPNPLTKKDIANLRAWLAWYDFSMADEDVADHDAMRREIPQTEEGAK